MKIIYKNWSLTLDLNGGRINELSHKDSKVFSTYQRIDGKVGSTHICAPSFDKEGQEKYNLPFHGYARSLLWSCNQQTTTSILISAKTIATEAYPAELELTQEFILVNSFVHRITIKHISGKPVPVNAAIHYYWDTPRGWGSALLNNKQASDSIKTNGFTDLQENNILIFPHAQYEVKSNGFHSAALWTSFKIDEKGSKTYNQDFCCVEPVIKWPGYFGTEESILHPGKTVSASIEVKKVV